MKNFKLYFIACVLLVAFASCRNNAKNKGEFKETRTSGSISILVDESFANVLDPQIEVFKSDYPETKFKIITGNEREIIPQLANGSVKMIVLSRMLQPGEESYYKKRQISVYTDRFAIDGIALITNSASTDTALTVNQVLDVMRGKSNRKLVFDNVKSSTVRYFMDSAKVNQLPKTGVYTLNDNVELIKYIAENKGYIGVIGLHWLLANNKVMNTYLNKIKYIGLAKKTDEKNADKYYKPIQDNLISGDYPFLRNIYLINCEGTDGLGAGFANWLSSQRGQLIVLRSGLAPHKLEDRQLNITQ